MFLLCSSCLVEPESWVSNTTSTSDVGYSSNKGYNKGYRRSLETRSNFLMVQLQHVHFLTHNLSSLVPRTQSAAFFSRRTRITPSTYVYTSFASDLVLAKSVAVGKTPRQTSLFDRLLYWLHIAWACCHHYEIESTLRKNRVHHTISGP